MENDLITPEGGLPDYLLCFRNSGVNETPIAHPEGLTKYAGGVDPKVIPETEGGCDKWIGVEPEEIRTSQGIKRSHNIWRKYASPVWMDIRQTFTLNAKIAREADDEKHLCPLQLDVIERACVLWSNPGEVVFTPFMGVGSEVYGAVLNGRKAMGAELKESYYNQAVRNLAAVEEHAEQELFAV